MFGRSRLYISIILLTGLSLPFSCTQPVNTDYKALINQGQFSQARQAIRYILATDTTLTALQKYNLAFESDRLNRIELDFNKTEKQVFDYIKEYIPDVTDSDIARWEADKSLEYKMIDGQKWFFNNAARNLFRINKECKAIWDKSHNYDEAFDSTQAKLVFNKEDQQIIDYYHLTGGKFSYPARRKIEYTLTVDTNAVPDGEIIRCWIPFPRDIQDRQVDFKVITTEPAQYVIAPNDLTLQRTIYLEKPAINNEPTKFSVEYEYTCYAMYMGVFPESVLAVDSEGEVKPYLQEEPPHIVFTDTLKALSRSIVGNETNPFKIGQKLFAWVNTNIPWASAREYSTIRNISDYAIENRHGDCGIETMLFITLCRYNGIPTRWQSGWVFEPTPYDNMHDWGMIYLEPYGWLPMDVTYGPLQTDNDELKWFYLHGMDSGRLIFNDAISQDFYPDKIYPRSETVDSQRGEVEWRGGNLYFDKWSWEMKYELLGQ